MLDIKINFDMVVCFTWYMVLHQFTWGQQPVLHRSEENDLTCVLVTIQLLNVVTLRAEMMIKKSKCPMTPRSYRCDQ